MNNLKSFLAKFTSIALAVLMTLSLSAGVMAKTFDDVGAAHEYKEQIDILSDIGVIVGTSETEFSPDENVTREQMAMLLFRLMLGRSNAGNVNSTDFVDLYDDTYNGAISWANASGYIIGTSQTTFNPTGGITLQDAMTMIIRALGQSTTSMDRGYPWTYIDAAIKAGLDKGLEKVDYEATLTRAQTAAILYNALTSEYLIQKTTSNGNTYVEKTTIIEYVFNYEIVEGIITATNTYSINDFALVIKDGFVTIAHDSDKSMTVKFDELGLEGKANDWLGKTIKVIYKTDKNTNTISVLGSTYRGTAKTFSDLTVADNNAYVTVDGVKYNVVEKLSSSLATNDNELLVYAYDVTGKLVQIKTNADIKNYLGFYNIEMIYDTMNSTVANRALIKKFQFAKLAITDDKINIAENLKADEITGGFDNEVEAKNGDYVLYYFNKGNKHLEIKEVITPTENLLVSKLTNTTATVGGKDYTLGSAAASVNPEDIRAQITVGSYISIVEKNNVILAINNAPVVVTDSKYLATVSNAVPVYTHGKLQHVVTAVIDGVKKDIVTDTTGITAGNVYRYIADENNVYVLYPTTSTYFTQTNEFASINTNQGNHKINKGSLPYYSYNGVSFVTDSKTVIVAKNGDSFEYKTGVYSSTIDVNDEAQVVAVYKNNTGNVKTLLFMYISNGSLGVIDESAQNVKVLAKSGNELVNGIVYSVYEVFNYNTGVREVRYSTSSALETGKVYVLDTNGNISSVASTVVTGIVTGHTSSTLSVNGNVYRLANDVKIVKVNADLTVTEVKLADTYLFNVEFTVSGGEVKAVTVNDKTAFSIAYDADNNLVAIYTNDNDAVFADADIVMNEIKKDSENIIVEQWPIVKGKYDGKNAIVINLYSIAAGKYTFKFTYNSAEFTVAIDLPAVPAEEA